MSTNMEYNAWLILDALVNLPTDDMGRASLSGEELQNGVGLDPGDINDAVTLLESSGYVTTLKALGSAPFLFVSVELTPLGRFQHQKQEQEQLQTQQETGSADIIQTIDRTPSPIGSPYGFTDSDWEFVSEKKGKSNVLNIVMGFQFKSNYYDTDKLKQNVENMFMKAVEEYNSSPGSVQVTLNFTPLAAGYGEHLFNEIARDVISADIAIFDASDLNPNVMIEMGVALTWGVRVLPIKEKSCPKPPSDISGQTWADYDDSASIFSDLEHHKKLVRMVERAARKKNSM